MNMLAPIRDTIVREADPGDEAAILAFLATHPDSTLFHRPAWSRAVELGCGQKGHYLLAERSGSVTGLLPLSHIRSPLFGSALVSAGFAVGGGILAADSVAANVLAGAAIDLAVDLGCPTIELRGGIVPEGWHPQDMLYAGFSRALPDGEEAILQSIPRKQRAEVRRALGHELEIHVGNGDAEARIHYGLYAESVRNLGTPVFPRSLFDAARAAFGDDADILTVSRGGRPLASVLSFYDKGTVFPYWGGGSREARHWRANELMYFALMRHAAARGCTRFDFGRSKRGTGAFAFKKNWGFAPEPLVYAVHGALREANPLNPRYRLQVAAWKRLPLPIANLVGPALARGLG
jgi:FemAB-related protein (PEP-CTERM system-associated)